MKEIPAVEYQKWADIGCGAPDANRVTALTETKVSGVTALNTLCGITIIPYTIGVSVQNSNTASNTESLVPFSILSRLYR